MSATVHPMPDPYAAAAHKGIAEIEKLEAFETRLPMDKLVQWRGVGDALAKMRDKFNGNKNGFGQWVRDNGLDSGKLTDPADRSNAMWLADNWKVVLENLQNGTLKICSPPSDLRTAARAGNWKAILDGVQNTAPAVQGHPTNLRTTPLSSVLQRLQNGTLSPVQLSAYQYAEPCACCPCEWALSRRSRSAIWTSGLAPPKS